MTVLNPNPKTKKSGHREKSERSRNTNNVNSGASNVTSNHLSHSPAPEDFKNSFVPDTKTSTDCHKTAKKVSFDKLPGPSRQQCASKPGCSGLSPSQPSSSYQSQLREEGAEGCNSDDEYGTGFLNDELERLFAQRLYEARGLEIKEVKGDGACMFRAVAAQVYGDEERHLDVRLHCIEYISRNRDHFSQFIIEDFDAYVARKRQAGVHGNHVELQAISEIYGRQIEIYEYDTKPVITFHPITAEANVVGEHPPLMLSYHGNVHYNSVIDPIRPVNINPIIFPNFNTNMHERISYTNVPQKSEDVPPPPPVESPLVNVPPKSPEAEISFKAPNVNCPSKSSPSKVSLYEELLASTVFDDDDESQSLAEALALSEQDFYNHFKEAQS